MMIVRIEGKFENAQDLHMALMALASQVKQAKSPLVEDYQFGVSRSSAIAALRIPRVGETAEQSSVILRAVAEQTKS